jgi:hypothetical protein
MASSRLAAAGAAAHRWRLSQVFAPALKEVPAGAVAPSHQLMIRAGLMRQVRFWPTRFRRALCAGVTRRRSTPRAARERAARAPPTRRACAGEDVAHRGRGAAGHRCDRSAPPQASAAQQAPWRAQAARSSACRTCCPRHFGRRLDAGMRLGPRWGPCAPGRPCAEPRSVGPAQLFRLQDRKAADFCLGSTHEEAFTSIVSKDISSHKQLPLRLYQIGAARWQERRRGLGHRAAHLPRHQVSRRGAAAVRPASRARIPHEGPLLVRHIARGVARVLQRGLRRVRAHLRALGPACAQGAGGLG